MTVTEIQGQSAASQTTPILCITDLSKSFGGVQALKGVSFDIRSGEVHALLGENGAGKSTMMNILAGIYRGDTGEIQLDGELYAPSNPAEARAKGISIVFQELALFPLLSVDANLYAGRELSEGIRLKHDEMRQQAAATLRRMQVNLRPEDPVSSLTIGKQQWVEIARAMTDNARILILDEPNSALNQHETEALFELLDQLKQQGITIIYISHRLEEVFRISDRVTVLRGGEYIGTWDTDTVSSSEVVSAMVGRSVDQRSRTTSHARDEVILDVEAMALPGYLKPMSFQVRSGEVVGLTGLAGAGMTDVLECLFGLRGGVTGEVRIDGAPAKPKSPSDAMRNDVAMVPADRRGVGLMPNWSVLDNITVSILDQLSRLGIVQRRKAIGVGETYVEKLNIVTDSLHKGVLFLSGGNQQKTLLARWLATNPRLLILDDPTRGIDVGAKSEVAQLVDEAAEQGVAVLLTSSEIEEVIGLSDRILVLRDGRLVVEVPAQVADKALLTELASGDEAHGLNLLKDALAAHEMPSISNYVHSTEVEATYEQPESTSGNSLGQMLASLYRIREIGVLQALLAVIIVFSFLTPYFLTVSNLLLITRQMAILGIIAVGMTFVLASGEVDLSVGWIFNMVMGVMATLMAAGVDPWLAIPVGLFVGSLLGMVNGLLAVFLQLPTIIVTLGTLTLYRGLALAVNDGRTISNLPESTFFLIGSGKVGPVPNMTLVMLVVFGVAAWVLANTRFARHLLIMGGNSTAAERVGLATKRLRVLVMTFSGFTCGIAGILGLAFLEAADPQSGTGYELIAIAAAIIGGAQLGGGAGTVWGTLIGIALIMAIQNGLVLLGLRPAWQITSTGLIIITAVTIDYLTRSSRQKRATRL